VLNDKRRNSDKRQTRGQDPLPSVASYAKIDDDTVEITTKTSTRSFPYQCSAFLSPARANTKSSQGTDKFASQPPHRSVQVTKLSRATGNCRRTRTTGKEADSESRQAILSRSGSVTRTNALLPGKSID